MLTRVRGEPVIKLMQMSIQSLTMTPPPSSMPSLDMMSKRRSKPSWNATNFFTSKLLEVSYVDKRAKAQKHKSPTRRSTDITLLDKSTKAQKPHKTQHGH